MFLSCIFTKSIAMKSDNEMFIEKGPFYSLFYIKALGMKGDVKKPAVAGFFTFLYISFSFVLIFFKISAVIFVFSLRNCLVAS